MKRNTDAHFRVRIALDEYGKRNVLKFPDLSTQKYEDELRKLKWQHGVRRFPPKKKFIERNSKPIFSAEDMGKKAPFLWVAFKDKVKIINETAKATRQLNLKKAKHTNLTAGKKAYSGGEMWFNSDNEIIINGCSGRYGPKSEKELNEIVEVLSSSGWSVRSLGWDSETRRPVRFPRAL